MQSNSKKEKNTLFIWLSLVVIFVLIAADQLTKMLVVKNMSLEGQLEVIPGLFCFKYVRNTGISFGLFSGLGMQIALSAVTVLIVAVILWFLWFKKPSSRLLKCALILVAAGGIGNAIDRIRLGYVIDFLLFEFDWFPYVFNVADCFVTVGGAMFCIYLIFGFGAAEDKEKSTAEDEEKLAAKANGGELSACDNSGFPDNAADENFADDGIGDDIAAYEGETSTTAVAESKPTSGNDGGIGDKNPGNGGIVDGKAGISPGFCGESDNTENAEDCKTDYPGKEKSQSGNCEKANDPDKIGNESEIAGGN